MADQQPAGRLKIRDDEPPPRMQTRRKLERDLLDMKRGSWVQVPHATAKSLQRLARQLGGSGTVYKTSELFSCFRVLEAPWLLGGANPKD